MSYEKAMAIAWRLLSALLTVMVGLTLFLVAGTASFDGKRLDIQTLGLLGGVIAFVVARIQGVTTTRSVELAFLGTAAGAVYAVATRDSSGEIQAGLVSAGVLAALAWSIRVVLVPYFEGRPIRRSRPRPRGATGPQGADPVTDLQSLRVAIVRDLERSLRETSDRRVASSQRIRRSAIVVFFAGVLVTWIARPRRPR